jgi:acyl carrier protein
MSDPSPRYPLIEREVRGALEQLSGRDLSDAPSSATFFELGFDSLLLTQAGQSLRQKMGVKISFRQLLEDLTTIDAVAAYLDERVAADKFVAPAAAAKAVAATNGHHENGANGTGKVHAITPAIVDRIVKQQLQLMNRQLELLRLAGCGDSPLVSRLVQLGAENPPSLERLAPEIAEDVTLPLPEVEKGLWLISDLNDDANRSYHLSVTLSFRGKLDTQALADALGQVVARHGALRTTISANGESQTLHAELPPEIAFYDFSATPEQERHAAALQQMNELENKLFPELHGPFMRTALVKLEPEFHYFLITFHHLIANGPSYLLFTDELTALYAEKVYGTPANLPPAASFADFLDQRLAYPGTEASRQAEDFWVKQFESGVPTLELPTDNPRPPEMTYIGDRQEIILDAALTTALRQVGAANRSSLFMMLFAGLGALLHRLSGQDDLVIGVPFDSLLRVEGQGLNLFANTTNMLPLRSILYDGSTFAEYLQQINALILSASDHQDYFFGNLIRKLNLGRDASRSVFFNVTFNRERGEFKKDWPGLEVRLETDHVPSGNPRHIAMFDLSMNAAERPSGDVFVEGSHNTNLIESETMKMWLSYYRNILESIANKPEQPVATLPLLSRQHLHDVVAMWQTGTTPQR